MAKYLKKFENHAAYETAQSSLILPNVSLCVSEGDVHYNQYNPPIIDGHEYVDLGLPSGTKWATMNVGANSITDCGDYYQYGKGANAYQVTSGQSSYSGTENPLPTTADTAKQVWGGSWHIPTSAQCVELTANTTYEWTTINGVNGGKFTAQNGNYIFIPAAGVYWNGTLNALGDVAYIWTSSPKDSDDSYYFYFGNGYKDVYSGIRSRGYSIRPVA